LSATGHALTLGKAQAERPFEFTCDYVPIA
jgi:hypothetical protein